MSNLFKLSFCPLRFKFKALELNRKILEGALVPKKPASKGVTKSEGFQLEIEKRLQERQASRKPEEKEDHTFHPRPLPTRILEEVVVGNSSFNPLLSMICQINVFFIILLF